MSNGFHKQKGENTAVGIRYADQVALSIRKNFALGRYSSLADSDHSSFFCFVFTTVKGARGSLVVKVMDSRPDEVKF
jgi:hypothetical protein